MIVDIDMSTAPAAGRVSILALLVGLALITNTALASTSTVVLAVEGMT